jgi:hypothetical protein
MTRSLSLIAVVLFACSLLLPGLASAAPVRAYLPEFKVTPADTAGLKTTLPSLLSSRLSSAEAIVPVASTEEAQVVIAGSYTQLGKVFSLDAVAKLPSGTTLCTVYEQGESQDDLIPALGRLSAKLKSELQQRYTQAVQPATLPATAPAAQIAAAAVPATAEHGRTVWLSQRLKGAQIGIAPARTTAEGAEYFIADSRALRLYRKEKNLTLLAEVEFPVREKLLAVDSLGPDQAGNPVVFVTAMDGESLSSKIYRYQDKKLVLVAANLPYMFRVMALNGGPAKLYGQEMSLRDDFFGDIHELALNGSTLQRKGALKAPRYGNIFNYNQVKGSDGTLYLTVLSPDGYLVVCSEAGEEIWRSNEKFGGSETYFQREVLANQRTIDDKYRWRFIDQRITVTAKGEIILPQNAGFFVLGNARSYSNHSMVALAWNGSSFEETWRSKPAQTYLADYFLDPRTQELTLLEVVQKEGFFSKGGSAIRVIRAE